MALGSFKYLFLLIFFEFDIFREIFFLQTKPKDYLRLSDVATIQELIQYFQRFHL